MAQADDGLPPTPELARILIPGGGGRVSVASPYAEKFQGLLADLAAAGYGIDPATTGGYNRRFIAGTTTPSEHAHGNAIDVNWGRNARGSEGDIPADLARTLAAKWGLTWGGDWHGASRDPMHFEVSRGPAAQSMILPSQIAQAEASPAPTVEAQTNEQIVGQEQGEAPVPGRGIPGSIQEQILSQMMYNSWPFKRGGSPGGLPRGVLPQDTDMLGWLGQTLLGGLVQPFVQGGKTLDQLQQTGGIITPEIAQNATEATVGLGLNGMLMPRPAGSLGTFGSTGAATARLGSLDRAYDTAAGRKLSPIELAEYKELRQAEREGKIRADDPQAQPEFARLNELDLKLGNNAFQDPGLNRDLFSRFGWFNDVDGAWKFEIGDQNARPILGNGLVQQGGNMAGLVALERGAKLGDVLHHPELFDAYPHLADMKVRPTTAGEALKYNGAYFPDSNTIAMNPADPGAFTSTLLHEVQHAIQKHEGFARGGMPSEFLPPGFDKTMKNAKLIHENQQEVVEAMGISSSDLEAGFRALERGGPQALARLPHANEAIKKFAQLGTSFTNDYRTTYGHYKRLQAQAEEAYKQYRLLGGEVESANVQERLKRGLGSETFPHDTTGYPPEEQNLRYYSPGAPIAPSADFPVFHGSRHLFPPAGDNPFGEFSDRAIGSGEGAQAFGYGHYVAQREGVGKSYMTAGMNRSGQSTARPKYDPNVVQYNGRAMSEWIKDNPTFAMMHGFMENGADPTRALRDTQSVLNGVLAIRTKRLAEMEAKLELSPIKSGPQWEYRQMDVAHTKRALEEAKQEAEFAHALTPKKISGWKEPNRGNLYEVKVKPEEHEFLSFDDDFYSQSPQVQTILINMTKQILPGRTRPLLSPTMLDVGTGQQLYASLARELGGGRQASEFLLQNGIKGNMFLDAGSRAKGHGTRNFVLYDPRDMEIVARNGERRPIEPVDHDPFNTPEGAK